MSELNYAGQILFLNFCCCFCCRLLSFWGEVVSVSMLFHLNFFLVRPWQRFSGRVLLRQLAFAWSVLFVSIVFHAYCQKCRVFLYSKLFVFCCTFRQLGNPSMPLYAVSIFTPHMDCQYARDPQPENEKKNVWFLFAFCFTLASVAASTCCIVVSRILVTVVSTRTVWKPCSRRSSEKLSCDES